MQDEVDETQGFAKGAVDYITKPISPAIVKARVKNHLSLVQADLLKAAQLELIQRLSHAAEYRDNETGQHIIRMSRYWHHRALMALMRPMPVVATGSANA